jgi:hypothetical protein
MTENFNPSNSHKRDENASFLKVTSGDNHDILFIESVFILYFVAVCCRLCPG